jgi:hypothetical protein
MSCDVLEIVDDQVGYLVETEKLLNFSSVVQTEKQKRVCLVVL